MLRQIYAGLAFASAVSAATLQNVPDFGPNPSNVSMYIWVPDNLAAKPPILVNPHWCHGDYLAAFQGSQFANLASTYGFIVIYPDSPNLVDKCWDVSSNATLTHNGGGDSFGIVSMVKYTIDTYNADPERVFVTGISSGAMMTNVLAGAYPDVFAAGSAFAGVPFGCFAGPSVDFWNNDCATGLITHTGPQWDAIVHAAFPSYVGFRPKMQVYHGTVDETVNYTNFLQEIVEWTAVLDLSETPTSTTQNFPVANWTKFVYGTKDTFEAYSAAGVDHNIPNQENNVMTFFDLTCVTGHCYSRSNPNGGGGGAGSSPPPSPTSSASVPATPAATGVSMWGQCGGVDYTGPTNCLAGTCHFENDFYSQCF